MTKYYKHKKDSMFMAVGLKYTLIVHLIDEGSSISRFSGEQKRIHEKFIEYNLEDAKYEDIDSETFSAALEKAHLDITDTPFF